MLKSQLFYIIYLVNIKYVPTYFNDFCYMFMYIFCTLILHENLGFRDEPGTMKLVLSTGE
jgi:hypothetical protein